jgi:predicted glycosyltransferase
MRVVISVTHLLGTGHLSRALTLARGFGAAGHEAHVFSGGVPVPNLVTDLATLHQLPPVRSDGINFTTLLDENGLIASEALIRQRKETGLALLSDLAPDVLITELFPFGRRVLKGEFLAMLNATRTLAARPLVLSSVRDILAPPSKPTKALETDAIVMAYYDGVLVHSDQKVTALDVSWPVSDALKDKLHYTGYVAPPPANGHPLGAGVGEVLVSAGGGDVGLALFRAAVEAANLDPNTHWRFLIGGSNKDNIIKELRRCVTGMNVTFEGTRPDFRQMLKGAKAAVCMCGYNTAMDLLQGGTRAVFVPFDAGGEVEQTLRAKSLALLPGYALVSADEATGPALLEALNQVLVKSPNVTDPAQFKGAEASVSIVEKLLEGRR